MDDVHTDGNAIAGLLSQLLAVDATSIARRTRSGSNSKGRSRSVGAMASL